MKTSFKTTARQRREAVKAAAAMLEAEGWQVFYYTAMCPKCGARNEAALEPVTCGECGKTVRPDKQNNNIEKELWRALRKGVAALIKEGVLQAPPKTPE